MTPSIEYIIWGVPAGQTEETILYSLARSEAEARRVIAVLEREHGCTRCRIHALDLRIAPDFRKVVSR
jgi:hypothetical protein